MRRLIGSDISERSLKTHFNVAFNFHVLVKCHLKFQNIVNTLKAIET